MCKILIKQSWDSRFVEKLNELEKKYGSHDEKIKKIFATLNLLLLDEKNQPKKEIGFNIKK